MASDESTPADRFSQSPPQQWPICRHRATVRESQLLRRAAVQTQEVSFCVAASGPVSVLLFED
jgi:hypothetical protein